MSTLRVSTIQDTAGSNSSTPAAIANGIAKAWVNFNGTGTVAIRAQYNVSSITDNGTGNYTVNFANALTDENYCVSFTPFTSRSDTAAQGCGSLRGSTRTTTSCNIGTTDMNDTVFLDVIDVNVSIFR